MPEKSEEVGASAGLSHLFLSRADEIAALPDVLAAWAEAQGVSGRTINYINLMLDELVSNIARHAYGGREDGSIELSASYDGVSVCISLRDDGPPFDPLSQRAPETALGIEEREFGGLGVLFVTKMADHLSYRRDGDANEIVFCRRDVRASA